MSDFLTIHAPLTEERRAALRGRLLLCTPISEAEAVVFGEGVEILPELLTSMKAELLRFGAGTEIIKVIDAAIAIAVVIRETHRRGFFAGALRRARDREGTMTRGSFTDTWPEPAEADAMNAAAADVQSAVASAADLLDHFRVEMEEGKLRDEAGRRAVQALAEICGLLAAGFTSPCYDGQNFFDIEHPVPDAAGSVLREGRRFRLVSNMQAGTDPAWFLFDTSRAVKSIIWQEREKYEFQTIKRLDDTRVFMTDEYLYGVRARANAGFGLWQLAFGSRAPLTAANYAAARASMSSIKGDQGRVLGIRPNVLVVPPALEASALTLLNTDTNDGGGSNPWKGTAEVIVAPWLAA